MNDQPSVLQLAADVADIKRAVVQIQQTVELWPKIMSDYDERLKHIIDQNDTIVQWATEENGETSWSAALRGISALLERIGQLDSRVTVLEPAVAAAASGSNDVLLALKRHDEREYARTWTVKTMAQVLAGSQALLFVAVAVIIFIVYNILARMQGAPAFTFWGMA